VLNLLELTPRRRRPYEERGGGRVAVLLPRYGEGRVGKLLERFFQRGPVKLELDEVGTAAWLLCDGGHTVQEIGELLRERFGERVEPVYDRLGIFVEQLARRGLVELGKGSPPRSIQVLEAQAKGRKG